MFNEAVGSAVRYEQRECWQVRPGEAGHAVFGPYEHVRPGRFRVDYDVALLDKGHDRETIVASLDVTAYDGKVELARMDLRARDLGRALKTISLTFTLREFRALEYRIDSKGAATLVMTQPRITRIGDVTDAPPPIDPLAITPDPIEQHRQARAILRLLRPCAAKGFDKVRIGHEGDGGYVCVDDFAGLDTALSFGINDDISWDMAAADRGLTIHQFDHTVEDPAPDDPRMHFNKLMIAGETSPESASLSDLVRKHDKGDVRPNMMLKMDIEGWEWTALEATPAEQVGRFTQIVCELHYFQGLLEPDYRARIYRGLSKLAEHYAVVHIHANIVGGLTNMGNVIFPNVLEVTFANRSIYEIVESDELYPSPLDTCCDPNQADYYLGAFRF